MADQTGPTALMRNVQDLRQRLAETENNLKKLNRFEKLDLEESESVASSNNEDCIRRRVQRLERRLDVNSYPVHPVNRDNGTITDDFIERESVRSGLSTVPDSYTGFTNRQFPSSTPNTHRTMRQHSDGNNDSDGTYDRGRLENKTRENNDKVVRQNQRLLAEVEKLAYELQSANCKIRELTRELKSGQQSIPDLEDKIIGQQAEIDGLEKALRKAEVELDENRREVGNVEKHAVNYRHEIDELRLQLNKERKSRKQIETQRDEALQNFLETQESLEEYQKKMRVKLKKQEESEDYLRDTLDRVNGEKDDLVEQLAVITTTLHQHEQEIRRLETLEEVEAETKSDMEVENNQLRKQIHKLQNKITKLQAEEKEYKNTEKENNLLKEKTDKQEGQLLQLQQEVDESRTMLVQLEQLADLVQHGGAASRDYSGNNDSGLSSLHHHGNTSRHNTPHSVSFSRSTGGEQKTEKSSSSSRPAKSIVSDLRVKLAKKDSEIQRLQAILFEHEANNNSNLIANLKSEILAMQERQRDGVGKCRDLESTVSQLETDNLRLREQVSDLRRDMSDREGFNLSLDSRLAQRNSQIIELQEDINKKCNEISHLERELRKKTSQVTSVQEQLEEKIRDYSSNIARSKQLEEEVIGRDEEITALQSELRQVQAEVVKHCKASEQLRQTHRAQCGEMERQIVKMEEDGERMRGEMRSGERQVKRLQEEVEEKVHSVEEMQTQLDQVKQELAGKTRLNQSTISRLEKQTEEREKKISELESNLLLCRDEMNSYVTTLAESKKTFEQELHLKNEKLNDLSVEVEEMRYELEEKRVEVLEYERGILERQTLLQQQSARIEQLESNQLDLHRKVAKQEQELLIKTEENRTEINVLERKLHQACHDLENKTKSVEDHLRVIRDYQEEKEDLTSELQLAEKRLEEEQNANRKSGPKISKLEKDVRDLRVQLEQKIEIIGEFEEQRRMREEDMSQQLGLVSSLDTHILKLKGDVQKSEDGKAEVERQLQKVVYEKEAKTHLLQDTQDMLSKTESELLETKEEVEELRQSLEERQKELDERVDQLNTLSKSIADTHGEMEGRMGRLNETLQKYEGEIKDRTRQIGDLDDTLQQTRHQLQESSLNWKQADQQVQRLQLELQAKSAKLSELIKMFDRLKEKSEEQKEENVELTQELRLTREQLQQQHSELMSTRRELAQSHREQDRLSRQLEEQTVYSQCHETDSARLAEELGTAKVREAQAEARLTAEVEQLNLEVDDLRFQLEKQTVRARELEKTVKSLTEKLKEEEERGKREREALEEECRDRLMKTQDEVECLQNELLTRKQVIDVANETVVIKDAEITRLLARISGYERALLTTEKDLDVQSLSLHRKKGHQEKTTLLQITPEKLVSVDVNEQSMLPQQLMLPNQQQQQQFYIEGLSEISGENILPPHVVLNRENLHFVTEATRSGGYNVDQSQPLSHVNHGVMVLPGHISNITNNGLSTGEQPFLNLEQGSGINSYPPTEEEGDHDITLSPENCYEDIRERLRCNALRQQMIEHELKMMDSEDSLNIEPEQSTAV